MRIGLDADGCFYPFQISARNYLINYHGYTEDDLPVPATTWEFSKHDWKMDDNLFYKLCAQGIDEGHIFSDCEPEDGFIESVNWLKSKGHTIHICTNRNIGTQDARYTSDWLKKHNVNYDSLTFAADKTIIDVDVFLEDKPENFYTLQDAGRRVYIFDREYNRHVKTLFRVKSWQDFAYLVDKQAKGIMYV